MQQHPGTAGGEGSGQRSTLRSRLAPVFLTSAAQINAQLLVDVVPGVASLRVGGAAIPIHVAAAAPAIAPCFSPSGPEDTPPPSTSPAKATSFRLSLPAPPFAAGPLSRVRAPVTAAHGLLLCDAGADLENTVIPG